MASREEIIALYAQTDERLRTLVLQLAVGNLGPRRVEELNRQIDAIIAELTGKAGQSLAALIGDEYRTGATAAVTQLSTLGVAANASLKPLVHQRAAQAIMDEAFYSILRASEHMSEDAKQRIKDAVRLANEKSLTLGMSRREATKQAIAEVNNAGITGVIASNGARIPADKYMNGVVHYHQRKAHVTGTENMAIQNGYDLMYVNYVGITCEHCAGKQGRVYSLSGNDKRFPFMDDKYKPPYHAHCVHSMSVWIEEYQSPEEVQRLLDVSSRLGEETRSEQHIRRYKEMQAQKAQLNADRKQFDRYRAVAPDETPKTFSSFRRMKYNNSERWQQLQGDYRKLNAYNKIVANEPPITADLRAVSKSTGVEMAGLEYRLKSKESYLRKVNTDSKNSLNFNVISETVAGTNDVIRYTYQSSSDSLVSAYQDVVGELKAKGYTSHKVKNFWNDKRNPYNGVNVTYSNPDGQKFEVQFHTPESFELKNGPMHKLYEEMRLDSTSQQRRAELSKEMFMLSSQLQRPDNIDQIK